MLANREQNEDKKICQVRQLLHTARDQGIDLEALLRLLGVAYRRIEHMDPRDKRNATMLFVDGSQTADGEKLWLMPSLLPADHLLDAGAKDSGNNNGGNIVGQTIAQFNITEKIGEGGMGYVYRARDLKLQRQVALKILPPQLSENREAKKQFLHEAQLLSVLDHPYICTIHDIFETSDGTLFMVMPCYRGNTLRNYLQQHELRPAEKMAIIKQIASGLYEAHKHDIIHQDIKPENILITEGGLVKIIDFGVACLAGRPQAEGDTTTMGTIAYMSPEQGNGGFVDQRSDIWSLGVVCYEMLSGKLPFSGDYQEAVIYAVLNEDPVPLENTPLQLQQIVMKCLNKRPEQRYQSIYDFLRDLEVFQARDKRLQQLKTKTTRRRTR